MAGRRKTIFSIVKVAFSNILTLLSGVFVGLILPKVIGVTDYGYYKTFSLYISYVGLFHFGIEDGIYLKYGGKDFSELDERKFRFYTLFLVIVEGAIGLIAAAVSCISLSGDIRFIFLFVAIYLFAVNLSNYYQFISQITERFTELTIVGTIRSILTILSVVGLWLLSRYSAFNVNYKAYIVCVVSITVAILFAYIIIYRKLTFGKCISWKEGIKDIGYFIKIGLPLMVANLCSTLLLTIDRQFVNILFDTDTYAVYAFAYNLLSLITTATSAISVVLFPVLNKFSTERLSNNYSKMLSIIIIFVAACLLVYFPICPFIEWFLPKYSGSLVIFRIILPGLIGTSAVTIIMHNYYKVLGRNLRFFILSIIILALAALADLAAYLIFKSMYAISIVSVFVIVIWYIAAEFFFIKNFRVAWLRNIMFMLCCMGAFYGITFIPNIYIAGVCYLAAFVALLLLFYFKEVRLALRGLKHKKKSEVAEEDATVSQVGVGDDAEKADGGNGKAVEVEHDKDN